MPTPDQAHRLTIKREERATDGVRKFLLSADGSLIEAVVIPGPGRTTLCLSTQAGCPVACTFCATGLGGLDRNLTADEIVAQLDLARAECLRDPEMVPDPITNIVYMGMGEPFLNYEPVVLSIEKIRKDRGFHSHIMTVSTIGVPERIPDFGRRFPHVRLAVSLHAATDETRTALVPLNRRFPIADVLEACREYQAITKKKLFFEYVMIRGVNDGLGDAARLAEILGEMHATVNLIPVHPGGAPGMTPPDRDVIDRFRARLKEGFAGHVTFRRSRGLDIRAACGQLRGESSPPPVASDLNP